MKGGQSPVAVYALTPGADAFTLRETRDVWQSGLTLLAPEQSALRAFGAGYKANGNNF
jgi:hypothetical protein